jgi:Ca2+-transporting ATPase
MMMATLHGHDDLFLAAVKGAPAAVAENCSRVASENGDRDLSDEDRRKWTDLNDELADDGLRVLALARKETDNKDADPYADLTLIGLVGLLDPARDDVPEAIARCREASVRVVMLTGDQPGTARSIAADIGLFDETQDKIMRGCEMGDGEEIGDQKRQEIRQTSIFARVTPRQKLTIIDIHRDAGAIVAMTGDGVNDAPALKKADIGIAMGKRGTEVARQAADMILRDDAFPTIVVAVRQGRIIFENIRKFVVYLLSGNVSEIIAVAVASMAQAPLPLLPLQILFLNLVLDVFPALALGVGDGGPEIMKRPPRPADESVLTRAHWTAISVYGMIIAVTVLGSLGAAVHWLDMPPEGAVTISFLTLSFSRMWHVFNMRETGSSMFTNEITRNGYVWAALGLCSLLIVGATQVPLLSRVLSLTSPHAEGWMLALAMSLIPLVAGQMLKKMGLLKL